MSGRPEAPRTVLRERVWRLLRFVLPLALIAWLVWMSWADVERLKRQSMDFGLLTAALALVFLALCVTILRWYVLVRALGMDFKVSDAFRLGFLAYLFNFVSLGSVGGDLFKAFFIAREKSGRRLDAISTVVVDRFVGLYGLLLVASTAIVLVEMRDTNHEIDTICRMVFGITLIATITIPLVLLLGLASHHVASLLTSVPLVGPTVERLLAVVRRYARRPGTLVGAGVMSVSVQIMLCLSLYLTARAIFVDIPTLTDHFFILPLSDLAGALPIFPSGLGTFDAALIYFYDSAAPDSDSGAKAVIIALALRVMQILIAAIGAGYYVTSRREVAEVMHAASTQQQEGE